MSNQRAPDKRKVNLFLKESDKDLLRQIAALKGITMTDFICLAVREQARKLKLIPKRPIELPPPRKIK